MMNRAGCQAPGRREPRMSPASIAAALIIGMVLLGSALFYAVRDRSITAAGYPGLNTAPPMTTGQGY